MCLCCVKKTSLSSFIHVLSVFANYHAHWAYHTTYKKSTSSSCVRSNPKRRWQRGNSLFLTNRTSNANCILRWQRNNSLLETRQFQDGLGVVMRRATCLRYLGPFRSHQPTHFSVAQLNQSGESAVPMWPPRGVGVREGSACVCVRIKHHFNHEDRKKHKMTDTCFPAIFPLHLCKRFFFLFASCDLCSIHTSRRSAFLTYN